MALSTIGTNGFADSAVTTAKVADDAVTGAKIENSPTIAGNLVVSGTTSLTGTVTASGATVGFVAPDKILLNATDGSATDAGDNLVLNSTDGSSDENDNILYEDDTNDASSLIGTSGVVLSSPEIIGIHKYPERPGFDIRGSAHDSIMDLAENTWTKVTFNTADWNWKGRTGYNIGNHWDTTNSVFKPTIAGLWSLEASMYFTYSSDPPDGIAMSFNDQDGQTLDTSYVRSADSTDEVYGSVIMRQIFNMSGNGSDTIEVQCRAWNSDDTDAYYSSFYGHCQGFFLG